jgi:TnpA family transposase
MIVPPELASMVAGNINLKVVTDHWSELLRLALSIKTGTVTASVILRKIAAYPRQNGLALALREVGKLERTLFTLQWLQDPELRRRSHVGLNKGEQQMRFAAPYSSTDSVKSAIVLMRISAIGPVG